MRNKKLIAVLIVVCSITLLVVLNSVIFSVRSVSAYCYNADDPELEQTVIEKSGIKKGGSIFTLNEKKVTDTLHRNVGNVKVINIEKKFPNRVYINYVKIFEYFRIHQGNKYYFCGNDGRILRISDVPGLSSATIELRLSTPISESVREGDKFASQSDSEVMITCELLSALERLDYHKYSQDMFDFVDISKSQYVFIKTRAGIMIELQGSGNLTAKLRIALSLYENLSSDKLTFGTIIVPDGDGREVQRSDENRYEKIMGKVE